MQKEPEKLFDAVKNYPRLSKEEREGLHIWLGMMGNFCLTVLKFVAGCITGSGFLCVGALYSILAGIIRRQYLTMAYDDRQDERKQKAVFARIGFLISAAGIVYGVYMGRLIFYPHKLHYEIWQGVVIALCCMADVGFAIYRLIHIPTQPEYPLISLAQKLSGLASALPAAVISQMVLCACLHSENTSFWDGLTGIAVGCVLVLMGLFMIRHTRKEGIGYGRKAEDGAS